MVEIARIERAVQSRRFLMRVFTESELAYYEKTGKTETIAGMWCVKEAVGKALGTGIVFPLTDIETIRDGRGKPYVKLHGRAKELAHGAEIEISVTHERTFAAAVAVVVRGQKS